MSAFLQALLASPQQLAAGPLRTLRYDDQNYGFFTYVGTWHPANGPFPGGSYLNTVTFRNSVVPSETLPTFTTKVIPFMGQPDESMSLWGAAEDSGKILLFIRALDSKINTGWVQFGPPIGTGTYRYQWRPSNPPGAAAEDVASYENSYLSQNYYNSLGNPGLVHVQGLPRGRYQFLVQKPANTTDPNDTADKALYFDGATVYTRHPTFA